MGYLNTIAVLFRKTHQADNFEGLMTKFEKHLDPSNHFKIDESKSLTSGDENVFALRKPERLYPFVHFEHSLVSFQARACLSAEDCRVGPEAADTRTVPTARSSVFDVL